MFTRILDVKNRSTSVWIVRTKEEAINRNQLKHQTHRNSSFLVHRLNQLQPHVTPSFSSCIVGWAVRALVLRLRPPLNKLLIL
mmetsp:Transcript_20781/g.30720  ORF Transcript_20781/g.30720 Transcript_20781/m.30720 type:complete len:83 (-) Transcript_20781:273-521(-)